MSLVGTYILYYIVIIFTSIIVYLSETLRFKNLNKLSKVIFLSAILVPIIIAGFRYGIGTDYFNYENIYYKLTSRGDGLFNAFSHTNIEPGWVVLNFFVKYVFDHVQYVFIISSILTWVFYFKAVYNHKSKVTIGISILILLCTMYNISFNTIRQTLAISIVILSIKPIMEKRLWSFLITILFASTFHYTALIFLPSYWIVNSKTEGASLTKKVIVPILFVSLILLINPFLSFITSFDIFSTYNAYNLEYSGFGVKDIIFKLPIITIILINLKRLKLNNNPMHRIVILYFVGIILTSLSSFAPHIDRISRYYDIMQIFILGAVVKEQNNKYEKFLYIIFLMLYYVSWFTYYFLILGKQETVPYQWM